MGGDELVDILTLLHALGVDITGATGDGDLLFLEHLADLHQVVLGDRLAELELDLLDGGGEHVALATQGGEVQ